MKSSACDKEYWQIGIILLFSLCIVFWTWKSDIQLLRFVTLYRNILLDKTFSFISATLVPVSIAIPFVLLIGSFLSGHKKMRRISLQTAIAELLNFGLLRLLNYTIQRSRPFITYLDIVHYTNSVGFSFPSGHTSTAFTVATSLSLNYPKWYVIVPLYTWAVLVSYSRLDLGVHYPTDVLAGILLGAGSSFLCFKAQKCLEKK